MTHAVRHWNYPQIARGNLPALTTDQMIEVDRLMIAQYGIILMQMMENAGRGLAIVARDYFGGIAGQRVAVLVGSGGNGGGALVAARRLASWGAQVEIFLGQAPDAMTKVPAHQLRAVANMGLPIITGLPTGTYDLILDGVIGYSLSGDPIGQRGELIVWANEARADIVALDAPSGLDTSTGHINTPAIRAAATVTLAMPKAGLYAAPDHVGRLFLADLSVPTTLYAEPSLDITLASPFVQSDIVEII